MNYEDLKNRFQTVYKSETLDIKEQFCELTVTVKPESVHSIIKDLKFDQVMDITAIDYPENEYRFCVVYHLLSITNNLRIRIKAHIKEDQAIESIADIYKSANWWERETYDMFGIKFNNHPDLRRILTDYNFEGYPLRKDFPTTGFLEISYDNELGQIVSKPVELKQKMRVFKYENPWNKNLEQMHQEISKSTDK